MNWAEHLYDKLQEECAETIQASAKTSFFGPDSIVPDKGITNEEHLINEIHDIFAIVDMLHENGLIHFQFDPTKIAEKKKKVFISQKGWESLQVSRNSLNLLCSLLEVSQMLVTLQNLLKRFWAFLKGEKAVLELAVNPHQYHDHDDHIGIMAQEVNELFPGVALSLDKSSDSDVMQSISIETLSKVIDSAVQEIGRVPSKLQALTQSPTWGMNRLEVVVALSMIKDRHEALASEKPALRVVEDIWEEQEQTAAKENVVFMTDSINRAARYAAKKPTYYLAILANDLLWPLNEKDITQLIKQEVIR